MPTDAFRRRPTLRETDFSKHAPTNDRLGGRPTERRPHELPPRPATTSASTSRTSNRSYIRRSAPSSPPDIEQFAPASTYDPLTPRSITTPNGHATRSTTPHSAPLSNTLPRSPRSYLMQTSVGMKVILLGGSRGALFATATNLFFLAELRQPVSYYLVHHIACSRTTLVELLRLLTSLSSSPQPSLYFTPAINLHLLYFTPGCTQDFTFIPSETTATNHLSMSSQQQEWERVGISGLDSTEIPDLQPYRLRDTFIDTNRLVHPDQVPSVFNYRNEFSEFTPEEELRFAIAFKHAHKEFATIAQYMPDRSESECKDYYYQKKHDGRFDTLPLNQREKTWQKLPDFDRRKLEAEAPTNRTDKEGNSVQSRSAIQLKKIVPIEEEIDRLSLIQAAPNAYTGNPASLAMVQAHIAQIRGKEKRDASEAVKMSKKMKKKNGKSNGESAKEPSFNATQLFEDIHRSLGGMKRGLVDLMASYEAALEGYRIGDSSNLEKESGGAVHALKMRENQKRCHFLEDQITWVSRALVALFLPDRAIEELKGDAEGYDRFGELFMCLISARTGIFTLEADHDSAASQLENLQTGDPELEGIVKERTEQLQGLVGDAHALIEAMGRSLLKEFQGFEELAQFMSDAAYTLAGEDRHDSVTQMSSGSRSGTSSYSYMQT
ncbi:hypothetical protein M409DRAFT_60832 [Zasmidium cellare ATCC 36951]|uniref:SANT domain-containing protein n=1 Tax=Zasmidium cellare ATCC 36951 TaxID=1080233 RepID=A0A6A6BZQ6_ZASCE|nr:uncharacterized protein M409DRAFT_60832 [Zasmidium cellare ATCC 36951]KAF2159488.1 hypothetical protein M409DRAFT_60832 [Zasmidium cellare ATCC 36951]